MLVADSVRKYCFAEKTMKQSWGDGAKEKAQWAFSQLDRSSRGRLESDYSVLSSPSTLVSASGSHQGSQEDIFLRSAASFREPAELKAKQSVYDLTSSIAKLLPY